MEKLYLCVFIIIFFAMLTIPMVSLGNKGENNVESVAKTVKTVQKSTLAQSNSKKIKVYLSETKKISEISITEYLVGVILCEMDESYPDEALKAQAVAAHTLLIYRQNENSEKDYDITDDYSVDQGYLTPEKRKKKYENQTENLEKRAEKLVKTVENEAIFYKNEPILAVYHDTSGGKTENAKDIWGGDYPYLVSVESISDLLNPEYLSTVTYTKQEFLSRLKSLGGNLPESEENYIGKSSTTDSGTVKTVEIGKKSFSGQKIRDAFDLRSANFDIEYKEGKFVFTVRGFGHGVGMSQYGAKFMGEEGSNYKEILQWYYTGCQVKSISD